jgi:hypothetical protein
MECEHSLEVMTSRYRCREWQSKWAFAECDHWVVEGEGSLINNSR